MRKNLLSILTITVSILACNERKIINVSQNNSFQLGNDVSYNYIKSKFGIIDKGEKPDSTSLVFYCLNSFDSSFLIRLNESANVVSGVYYLENTMHTYNSNDTPMDENHPSYFTGYSFRLDLTKWESVKHNASLLLADSTTEVQQPMTDGQEFGLLYGSRVKTGSKKTLGHFSAFLNKLFIVNLVSHGSPKK